MRSAVISFLLLLSLTIADPAGADVRHAAPFGSGTACTSAAPCGIQVAVESASPGDEVVVGAGTYNTGSDGISATDAGLTVRGSSTSPKPVVVSTAAIALDMGGAGSIARDLEIRHSTGPFAVRVTNGSLGERLLVKSTSGSAACVLNTSATIRDSVCEAGGTNPTAVLAATSVAGSAALVNVTAVGTQDGVYMQTNAPPQTLSMTNVIAQGGTTDLRVVNSTAGSVSTIAADHSNFASVSTTPAVGSYAVDPAGSGTNQTAEPLFSTTADYTQDVGSPTVDAGAVGPLTGTNDLSGEGRVLGAAIDIGADETAAAPAAPSPTGDTASPETTIAKGPKRKTRSKKATFVFSSNEAGSTFTCAIDKKPAASCTSPLKLSKLKRGKHTLSVVAADAAGNADATPATYRWKVAKRKKPKKG